VVEWDCPKLGAERLRLDELPPQTAGNHFSSGKEVCHAKRELLGRLESERWTSPNRTHAKYAQEIRQGASRGCPHGSGCVMAMVVEKAMRLGRSLAPPRLSDLEGLVGRTSW
jgi:hypothetical protein